MPSQRYKYQPLWPATALKPLLGFAAYSGTGKTTLLRELIPLLTAHGIRLSLIKHAHHNFDIDRPGKDSYELRKAGASQVLVCSAYRTAMVTEHPQPTEPRLADQLARLDQTGTDLILVEGFKSEHFPKIELWRPELGHPPRHPSDPAIVAVATDAPEQLDTSLPILDINAPDAIARFIRKDILETE
ncbi:molybdopterin-guanine dinucleotide biosynthesis protein B [Alkalilimnicola ehrlichii]|uniref:Molybdopterin-guanine dinucleotide biosynthesis protein B n=1 Tax=Alkalilimnicola ehrlichii TaxID=351052 RepID=A0A3E0X1U3_9GAMM|nr:molybdopterin-guanine dinucleotide biosynthesis protein B [Alkalilimnicola ehrlichii]RFA31132.1 molybdopterin-guanine dinucleotide biosynthesis protein B [Alkalilimnicola ehrlichii]RFA39581.1 molybdopterin-guanine dinucleotide biosynthesis protein B [Alkalilimnicola ehrlichii]